LKAKVFYDLEEFEEALKAIEKAIKIKPDGLHYELKGAIYLKLNQNENAI